MDWRETVFDYCERQSSSFWAEPANALTNGAFLVAAGAAFVSWRRQGGADYPALALIFVTAVTGVGSFIFHTVATRGAMLLDVIPIALFIYAYFLLALRRFFGLGLPAALALTIFFALVSYAIGEAAPGLNGSVAYLPALVSLATFSMLLWWRETPAQGAARGLGLAALVFLVSLAFRTVDRAICPALPVGTHFVWHLLNALVLWLLLGAAMNARKS